jgi:hypothetical protein
MPREPALLTSAAMDGEAQSASRERSPGWAQRTSGDGAWAAPIDTAADFLHSSSSFCRSRLPCFPILPRLSSWGQGGEQIAFASNTAL